MKRIIKSIEKPFITAEELYKSNNDKVIITLEVVEKGSSYRGRKYVLGAIGNSFSFLDGHSHWGNKATKKELIDFCLADDRVVLYCFDSILKLAKWLCEYEDLDEDP